MFILYTLFAVVIMINAMLFAPQYFVGAENPIDPQRSSRQASGEFLAETMLAYHHAALSYLQANPTFRGTIADTDISITPFIKQIDWRTIVVDVPTGEVDVFTYADEALPTGTSQNALISGLYKANFYALGTGIVQADNTFLETRGIVTYSDPLNPTGPRDAILTRSGPPINVPPAIPVDSVVQFTRL